MGYGGRIRHVERVPMTSNNWSNYCKNLYITHKSQEIYMMPETVNHWVKPEFTMKVSGQLMHPISVIMRRIPDEDVPEEIRMQHLLGAL